MKTTLLAVVGVLVAIGAGALGLLAADPVQPASRGKLLLLENERVLEGDIERIGDQYRVKRSIGETWMPGERVLCLCDTVEEAYIFLRGRANLDDADERLRLAQWCRNQGLRRQALEEVKAAVELRPEDAALRRLLNGLLKADEAGPPKPVPVKPEPVPLPPVDLSAESLNRFVTHVQPILMNTCASCHATGNGGNFRLWRVHDIGAGNRKLLQQNAAAVAAQINFREPLMSPLLIKSVSSHCETMGRAPLKDRQAPAYRALQDWVRQTVATNPHLIPRQPETTASVLAPAIVTGPTTGFAESKDTPAETVPTAPQPITSTSAPTAVPTTTPAAVMEKGTDVVDPDEFNRQNHPQKPPNKP